MTHTHRFLEYSGAFSAPPGSSVKGHVDRQTGVIRGVKLLGLESRNGRTYPKETVARAMSLYEGVRVNVDHPRDKPTGPRSYTDRIGVIRNVSLDQGDGGLRGDFHANPKHALFEQLAWDAENAPESVGFSHDIRGKTSTRGGKIVVEEIAQVISVDLVADPATTQGLFEGVGPSPETLAEIRATAASVGLPRCCLDVLEFTNDVEARKERVITCAKRLTESGDLPVRLHGQAEPSGP